MAKNRRKTRKKRTKPSQRMSLVAQHPAMTADRLDYDVGQKRNDVLPDDVLLDIFDFYMKDTSYYEPVEKRWHPLVHVCRRWRSLVFGSPRRLDLKLYCTLKTPTRDSLDIWPALPLVVSGS